MVGDGDSPFVLSFHQSLIIMLVKLTILVTIKRSHSSRFSNLLTVLAYIDICYVTVELAHIGIKIWASVIIIISWVKELFHNQPGRSWARGGHILLRVLPLFFPPSATSVPDRHGPPHSDIQVDEKKKIPKIPKS